MDPNEIIRLAAADLTPEFGADLVDTTDQILAGRLPPAREATRDWGEALPQAMYALGVAHYLIALTPRVVSVWNSTKDLKKVDAAAQEVGDQGVGLPADIQSKVQHAVKERLPGRS